MVTVLREARSAQVIKLATIKVRRSLLEEVQNQQSLGLGRRCVAPGVVVMPT